MPIYEMRDTPENWFVALVFSKAPENARNALVQLLTELYGSLEAELWASNPGAQCENLARLLRHAADALENSA